MGRDNRKNNCGGRGPAHNKNKNKDQKNTPKRKTLADHIYHVGSAKQASDYVTVTNCIVSYVRRTFDKGNDITRALEDEATYDLDQFAPTLRTSTKTEATETEKAEKARENRQIRFGNGVLWILQSLCTDCELSLWKNQTILGAHQNDDVVNKDSCWIWKWGFCEIHRDFALNWAFKRTSHRWVYVFWWVNTFSWAWEWGVQILQTVTRFQGWATIVEICNLGPVGVWVSIQNVHFLRIFCPQVKIAILHFWNKQKSFCWFSHLFVHDWSFGCFHGTCSLAFSCPQHKWNHWWFSEKCGCHGSFPFSTVCGTDIWLSDARLQS